MFLKTLNCKYFSNGLFTADLYNFPKILFYIFFPLEIDTVIRLRGFAEKGTHNPQQN